MRIDQLHITHIYQGLLACSNIKKFNIRFLSNIDNYAKSFLPKHAPLHITIPDSAPDHTPCYLIVLLIDGTPKNDDALYDENGEAYNSHWLGIARFIEEVTPSEIENAIQKAKEDFDEYAKGYFF